MARNFTFCLAFLVSLMAFGHQVSAQTANAGPNQTRCSVNTATMAGNAPAANNKGRWTYVSGTTGNFATGNDSLPNVVFTAGTATPTGSTVLRWTIEPGLVISQIYTHGGSAGATYINDFVELHNRSSQTINLTGYSLQYAAATGNFATQYNLVGTIAPGAFFLVSLGSDGAVGVALPTANGTSTAINMALAGGKIALFKSTTLQSSCGSAACSVAVKALLVDLVAYGTASGEVEGTVLSALTATTSARRNPVATACTDTNNNGSDFTAGTVLGSVRNSSTTPSVCGGGSTSDMTITWSTSPLNTNAVTENSGTANDGTIFCGSSAVIQALATPGTYLWSSGQTTQSITVSPTSSTTFSCTITNAGCSAITSRLITVSPVAVSTTVSETSGTLPNDGNICTGASATITALPAGSTYLWSNGATTQSITVSPAATTNFTVTVTTSPGCTNTAVRTITVNVPSAAIAVTETSAGTNNDGTICQGASAVLTATGGIAYLWSTAAITGAITVNPVTSTTYTVSATNSSGCIATANRSITVLAAPTPVITVTENSGTPNDGTICFGLSATMTVSGASTYAWSPAGTLNQSTGTTVVATPLLSTTYTVTATDASSCSATTTAQIIVDNPAADVTITETSGLANNDGTICGGATAVLSAKPGQTSYTWVSAPAGFTSNMATISVSPTVTTFYNLTVTNAATGCVGQNSIQITEIDFPSVTIGVSESSGIPDDGTICDGTSALVAVSATAGTTYSWSSVPSGTYPATASINVSPSVTTTYSLTASTSGCVATNSRQIVVLSRPDATITVTENSALAANDRVICRGDNATIAVPDGAGSYSWISSTGQLFSDFSINVSPTVTTTYSVTITGINGCTSSNTTSITVTDPPSTTTTVTESSGTANDGQVCLGGSATIAIPNVAGTVYSWVGAPGTFTSTLASFTQSPTVTTTYSVTATRAGCTSTGTVLLVVNPFPSASITVTETSGLTNNDARICLGSSAQLSVPTGALTYSWASTPTGTLPGLNSINVSPTVNTTYNLTVTGAGGCTTVASPNVTITVTPTPSLTLALVENSGIPNNGDVCMNVNSQFTATSALATGYSWSSVPAAMYPSTASINVSPTVTTIYTVVASITATGCSATARDTLNVFQALALCKPYSIKMNTPTAGITLADIDNGSLGTNITIDRNSFSCLNIGSNPVVITATNAFCSSTCTANVTIIDGPGCSPALNSGAPTQPTIVDPCVCKGTATNLQNGQFSDKVTVQNAFSNERWVVKNVLGLYRLTTPLGQDPLIPVLPGDQLTENQLGMGRSNFTLSGFHIDSVGYFIEVWRLDPSNVGIPGSELSTSNRCYYPTPVFSPKLPSVVPSGAPAITLNLIDVNAQNNSGGIITSSGPGVVGNVFTPSSVASPGTYLLSSTLNYGNPTGSRTGQDVKNPVCASTIRQNVTVDNNLPALNCRSSVNFSLDKACSVNILAGDFLLGAPAGFGGYEAIILNGNTVVTQITPADVNKTYTVRISDLSTPRNFCWSAIKIEDKTAPIIDCSAPRVFYCEDDVKLNLSGIPTVATPASAGAFTLPVVNECSAYTLTFSDQGTQGTCADNYTFRGARNYTAIDQHGNATVCAVPFEIRRRYLVDIIPPADITLNCSDVIGSTVDTLLGKQPKILGKNLNQFRGCKLGATYTDVFTPSACGIGFTIRRQWVMTSDCEVTPRVHDQLITVKDLSAPSVISMVPDISIFVATNTPDCKASGIALPLPVVKDNCDGNPKINIQITRGSTIHGSGTIIWNLVPNTYFLNYTVTDQCGNATTFSKILVVQDKTAPAAVCRTNVLVSLTRNDSGVINAQSLDGGSSDNCCFDVNRFEARRMSETDADYKPTMNVRCADSEFMALLRVWDCEGNSNTCMTNVIVVDKLAPIAVPENITVDCGNDATAKLWLDAHPLTKLSVEPSITNPGYFDHFTSDPTCTVEAKVTKVIDSLDQCGNGFYAYDWTVTDQSGNSTTVQQRYTSRNVSLYSVTFPKDTTIILNAACDTVGTSTRFTGKATIDVLNGSCPIPTLNYFDQAAKVSDDSICFRIVRVWRVSNLCRPMPADVTLVKNVKGRDVTVTSNDNNGGFFEYSQIINVIDLTPPDIISVSNPTFEPVDKECKVRVSFGSMSVKDCSGQRTKQTFTLFKENGQVFPVSSNDLPGSVEVSQADFGKFRVVYTVTDACGNANSRAQSFTVKDVLKPTPVCHDNVAIEISQTGIAMLQAKVVDAGSYDNCTKPANLKFRLRVLTDSSIIKLDTVKVNPDTLPGMYTFVCPPKGSTSGSMGTSTIWKIQLWVGDEAGNWDFCETIVQLQDNFALCNYDPNEMRPLEVEIKTEKGKEVENVAVQLFGTKIQNILSNKVGKVKFNDLPIYGSYVLAPNKNEMPLNGVSTFDLVMMSKHILGVQKLTSPYQYIAADVNRSNSISVADIVELRKMLLAVQNGFSKNTSWRFVDKKYQFPDLNNPWTQTIPEKISLNGLLGAPAPGFVGVKIGDVNLSATASQRSESITSFQAEDRSFQSGDIFTVNFKTKEELDGYQFTFEYDKNALELIEIPEGKDGFALIENGVINASQILTEDLSEAGFSFVFRAKSSGRLSEALRISSRMLVAEAYGKSGEHSKVEIAFHKGIASRFELYQNQPNPFNGSTSIGFNIPEQGNARLTITDVSGRVVKVVSAEFSKGYHQLLIERSELGAAGIFYYTLETATQTATRKMILLE